MHLKDLQEEANGIYVQHKYKQEKHFPTQPNQSLMYELLVKNDVPHESHMALQFNYNNTHGVVADNAINLNEFS